MHDQIAGTKPVRIVLPAFNIDKFTPCGVGQEMRRWARLIITLDLDPFVADAISAIAKIATDGGPRRPELRKDSNETLQLLFCRN
jgi:hypothetical protein